MDKVEEVKGAIISIIESEKKGDKEKHHFILKIENPTEVSTEEGVTTMYQIIEQSEVRSLIEILDRGIHH